VNVFPAGVGEDRSVYGIKVGMPKWKRKIGRRRSTWEDTNKDFRETG
jgi:hypothetical protein